MKKNILFLVGILLALCSTCISQIAETTAQKNTRMQWWRDARFGMFIHWGLYSVPAGEWKGTTNHAEWIRTTAQIPLEEYDGFMQQFNPVNFNADGWVKMAKDAGMKYITITSKHHDGFALWDSKVSEFDIMSTPFKRDILKELADACRKAGGIKLCFYHSIMDWHHPDYNERREWEKNRPTENNDRARYIAYMKAQLKELLTNYGDIGVLWFDGEWEGFWTHEDGKDLYNYVRSLQPGIIINNRVDKGRGGMQGMTAGGDYVGDFGTPEQEIPDTGLPGIDWESCMTMNNNWGYNKHDKNFKSAKTLVRNLIDIASKGGNFLLNIGPEADGSFPPESVERLKAIGNWMKVNGESIYGTKASPFEHITWGRVTQKQIGANTRIYLHVFDWPTDGKLVLTGLDNAIVKAAVLGGKKNLAAKRTGNNTTIQLPASAINEIATVVAIDIKGKPIVYRKPEIVGFSNSFLDTMVVRLNLPEEAKSFTVRYTTDGSEPNSQSSLYTRPIVLNRTSTIKAASFRGNKMVSEVASAIFEKIEPLTAMDLFKADPGLQANYYDGDWDKLPDFSQLTPSLREIVKTVSTGAYKGKEKYGIQLQGFIQASEQGVYHFYLSSDDGSALYIDGKKLINNDGLHGTIEKKATVALAAGFHSIRIDFFEKTGGDDVFLTVETEKMKKQEFNQWFFH